MKGSNLVICFENFTIDKYLNFFALKCAEKSWKHYLKTNSMFFLLTNFNSKRTTNNTLPIHTRFSSINQNIKTTPPSIKLKGNIVFLILANFKCFFLSQHKL